MTVLKKVLMIVLIIFLVISSIGVFVVVYENTSLFKKQVLLNCDINNDGKKFLFTLVVDRKGKKVFWRGRKEGKIKERIINNFTDTEIKMTWKNDKGFDIEFVLNRLDGRFDISILRPNDKRKTTDMPDSYFKTNRGNCYERQQKY